MSIPSGTTGSEGSRLSIFLSYGHDEHSGLAVRLKADLEARGHEVWFDAERIRDGGDWERYIEEGLERVVAAGERGRVLTLMTPYSMRRPDGFCLNELARAVQRRVPVVPVMVVWIEPPLSICRIQWLDMRDAVPADERSERYEAKLDRLVDALENNRLDYEGAQSRLLSSLSPLEFAADLARHGARFTGRGWVFDRIRDWLADPGASRVFWITGKPGVGKTAIACRLASTWREVAAFHLCRHGDSIKSDPRRAVLSIAYQLSTQLPDYQSRLASMDLAGVIAESANARTLFDALILQPLSGGFPEPDRTLLVVVDGLDEATAGGRNELASFIGSEWRNVPPWLRLVVTGRPDAEVRAPLQGLSPFVLDASSPENEADLREFLARELAPYAPRHRVPEETLRTILARSEGVFLYAEWVREELSEKRLSLDRPDEFPQGLGGVYLQFFQRQFPDVELYQREVAPALDAVLAAREPLPLDLLRDLAGWSKRDLARFRTAVGSLFDTADERIRPFHETLADWLANPDPGVSGPYFVDAEKGTRVLADHGLAEYAKGKAKSLSDYWLLHLPVHLAEAERDADVAVLLGDVDFLLRSGQLLRDRGDAVCALERLRRLAMVVGAEAFGAGLETGEQRRIAELADEAGRVISELGDSKHALMAYEAGQAIVLRLIEEDPTNEDWQMQLARSWNNMGDIYYSYGKFDFALSAHEAALTILQRLSKLDPNNMDLQCDLAETLLYVGDVRLELPNRPGGEDAYDTSLAITQRLTHRDPSNAGWNLGLAAAWARVGDVRLSCSDLAGALEARNASLAVIQQLLKTDPAKASLRFSLSQSWGAIGKIYFARNNSSAALDAFDTAKQIMQCLLNGDPANTEYLHFMSGLSGSVGDVRLAYGDVLVALDAYEAGLNIMLRLTEQDPHNRNWQFDLATAREKVGECYWRRNLFAAAKDAFEGALALMQGVLDHDPERPDALYSVRRLREMVECATRRSKSRRGRAHRRHGRRAR